MALEAVVFPPNVFGYSCKDLHSMAAAFGGFDFKTEEEEQEDKGIRKEIEMGGHLDQSHETWSGLDIDGQGNWDSSFCLLQNIKDWDTNSSLPDARAFDGVFTGNFQATPVVASGRRKRRRSKSSKNKEDVENQRMTHIAVERNRRKQMNEYLAVLRSLMPSSYVQRGDQASIIGGAINFVKELEQLLQSLEAQKQSPKQSDPSSFSSPFSEFFIFPQYSSSSLNSNPNGERVAENRSPVADIEVTMVESHANLKILSKKRPKQLLKMVAGLQNLRLTVLHLNVTSSDQMVLYSFSVKVEDGCSVTSVDEIATAVYHMLGRIQEESNIS